MAGQTNTKREAYKYTTLVLDKKEYATFLKLYSKKHLEEQGQLESATHSQNRDRPLWAIAD